MTATTMMMMMMVTHITTGSRMLTSWDCDSEGDAGWLMLGVRGGGLGEGLGCEGGTGRLVIGGTGGLAVGSSSSPSASVDISKS